METVQDFSKVNQIPAKELWTAVKTRDRRYYSRFVYGVKSTGIFCRPTCPSKKPLRRNNIAFFTNPTSAMESGFKACKRCKPNETTRPNSQEQTIQKLCEYITNNWEEKLSLSRLSEESRMSPFHLQRTFKKITGISPREYVEAVRINRLRLSLKSGNSVRESTYGVGYNSSGWLYFRPNEKLGMSPQKYKKGAEGLEISYVITNSPLGRLLVAATERGVCLVSLGDSFQRLAQHLQTEFPKAKLQPATRANRNLSNAVRKISDYLIKGTDLQNSSIPLDLQATAFQQRVWKELRAIPYGGVRSYSDIAKRIGLPRAVRAVGNACASNPVPLVVPCHRVVPKSGGVGNYGLGVDRKKILLEKEGVNLASLEEGEHAN